MKHPLALFFAFLASFAQLLAAPTVSTLDATQVGDLSVTLPGTINVNSVGSWLVDFEITEDADFQSPRTVSPESQFHIEGAAAGNNTLSINVNLQDLTPSTTYQFRFRTRNVNNLNEVFYGATKTFTTLSPNTPPTATILPHLSPTPISDREAELRSEVFSGSSPTKVFLQYGTSPSNLTLEAEIDDLILLNKTEETRIHIDNLTPSQTYYYRWLVTNTEGSNFSSVQSFTTTSAPTVTTLPATNVVDDSAVMNGSVNLNGGMYAFVFFEYGETSALGKSISATVSYDADGIANISTFLPTLKSNTQYHYRLVTRQNQSRAITYGNIVTFTTVIEGEKPVILTEPATSSINASHVIINAPSVFTGTSDTTLKIEYGTSTSFGNEAAHPETLDGFTTYSNSKITLTNLLPNTLYHFRLVATNTTGSVYSDTYNFQTFPAPTAVNDGTLSIGDVSTQIKGTFTNFGGFCQPGVEWGTSTAYGNKSTLTLLPHTSTTTTRTASLSTEPSTLYHYRFFVFDGTNYHYSADKTFTSTAPNSLPAINDPKIKDIALGVWNPYRKQVSAESALCSAHIFSGGFNANFEIEYGTTNSLGQTQIYDGQIDANSSSFLFVQLSNLDPETTYFWRAKATNASGSVYSPIESFTTLKAPIVTSQSSISVTDSSATLVGTVSPDLWNYDLEFAYGTDLDLSSTITQTSPDYVNGVYDGVIDTSTRNVTAPLTSLQPNTTYYYQLRARTKHFHPAPIYASETRSFTTSAPSTKPTITQTIQLLSKSHTSAQLILGGFKSESSAASVAFEYGTSQSYGSDITHPDTFPAYTTGSPSIEIASLLPDTTYHVRARVTNAAGSSYSTNFQFTTLPQGSAPVFSGSPSATSITFNSAQILAGSLDAKDANATVTFKYGLTTAYGTSIEQSASANTITQPFANIANLQPNTTYHFKVTAENAYGTTSTSDFSFTTANGPEATTLAATAVTDISAILNAEFTPQNLLGYLYFDWGETSSYGNSFFITSTSGNASTEAHSTTLSDLQPNTTYHFRARFRDRFGNEQYGQNLTFTTSAPYSLPTITGTPVTTELSPTETKVLVEKITPGGSPATITFEYGENSNFTSSLTLPSPLAVGSTLINPTALLEELTPNTTYSVRVKASNLHGSVTSPVFVFSTAFHLTTNSATAISHHEAQLHGEINPGGQELTTYFYWGTSPSSTNIASLSPNTISGFSDTSVAATLVTLSPDTTYYFRLVAVDAAGFKHYGQTQSFTTGTQVATPTIMGEISSNSNPTATAASFRTPTIHSGNDTTTLTAEYGTNNNFGSSIVLRTINPNSTANSYFSLTNLLPDTEYQVRVKAENSLGSDLSNTLTFRTLLEPVVSTLPATQVTDLSATLNASLQLNGNPHSSTTIVYGSGGYFNRTIYNPSYTIDASTGAYLYSAPIEKLSPSTVYQYKLKMGTYESTAQSFTTASPSTPPVIQGSLTYNSASDLSDTKIRLSSGPISPGSSASQLVIQYGTTTSYGSETPLGNLSAADSNRTFTAILSGLTPNTLYHARIKATNSEGVSFSPDISFTTYATPELTLSSITDVTDISANFAGTVNPKGRQLDVRFTYTKQSGLGTSSAAIQVAGNATTPLSYQAVHVLDPETTYTGKLTISDGLNSYSSNTIQFTTLTAQSPPVIYGNVQVTSLASQSTKVRLYEYPGITLSPGSSDATLSFEYGTTESYGQSVSYLGTFRPGTTKYTSTTPITLPNLTADTTYFVRAKLTNAQGTTYSNPILITTLPPILVETADTSDITEFSAKLYGNYDLQSASTAATPSINSSFEWGTSESFGSSANYLSPTTLTNLTPGTTYYYRLRVKYSTDAAYYYGDTKSFSTLAPQSPPSVSTPSITFPRASSARVSLSYTSGGSPADVVLEYGLDSSLTSQYSVITGAPAKATSTNNTLTLNGLLPSSTYYLRVKASSAQGTTLSSVISFRTTDLSEPFDLSASNISSNSAILNGYIQSTASPTSVRFEYGTTTSYGSSSTAYLRNGAYSTNTLYGLLTSNTYHYRMVVVEDNGTTIYSDDMSFTTSPSPNPPVLSDQLSAFRITSYAATLWMQSISAPADIIFEYGTTESLGSQVLYPYNTSSTHLFKNPSIELENLVPDTLYYYRVSASNSQGQVTSPTKQFKTLKAPDILAKDAEDVLGKSASLMGEIHPNKNLLETAFEYGLTTNLGSTISTTTPVIDGNSSLSLTVPLGGLQPETTYHYRVTARDERGKMYTGPLKTVTTLELLQAWRKQHYGTTENTGDAADLAAPFGDGTANIIKYALGLQPHEKLPLLLRQNDIEGSKRLGLTFNRDPLKTNLIYRVQVSDSLVDGSWQTIATSAGGALATGTGHIVESPTSNGEITVEVSDTNAMNTRSKLFMRLNIEQTSSAP